MVVFTCNNCGDSVKKPKVEKHIAIECRKKFSSVSLCCVDCLKDFNADTFVEHTKCVTELERYSAKGFKPKPSFNKGERKQNSWIDVVQSVLSLSTLSHQQRELLQAISHFNNIPRKKAKFQNFVRSSIRHIRVFPDAVDSVFDLLEGQFKETTMSATISNHTDTCVVVSANEVDLMNSAGINKMTNDVVHSKEEKTNSLPRDNKSEPFESHPERKKNKRKTKRNSEEMEDVVIPSVRIDSNEQITHNDFEIVEKRKKIKKKAVEKDISNNTESASISIIGGRHSDNVIPKANTENYNESYSIGATATSDDTSNSSERVSKKNKKKLKLPSDIYVSVIPADDDVANNGKPVDVEASNTDKATHTAAENVEYNHDRVTGTSTVSIDDDDDASVSHRKTKKVGRDRENVTSISESQLEVTAEIEGSTVSTSNTRERERIEKKKKRKLASDDEDDYTRIDKSRRTELLTDSTDQCGNENHFNGCNKFVWEDVIQSVLRTSSDEGISLKKMTKKVVNEYRRSFSDNKSYDEIAKKLKKKITKLPYVIVR